MGGALSCPGCAAVIPARYASRRLPGKPLLLVGGVPIVERVRRAAALARSISRVVVATDDERIARVVRDAGGEVLITPDAPSGTHRVASVLDRLEEPFVLDVQCDQPFLEPAHLDRVVALLRDGAEVATLAVPLPNGIDPADPSRVKVVLDTAGRALYFSRAPIPSGGPWLLHIGIYGFRRESLLRCTTAPASQLERSEDLEQLRWLAAGLAVHVAVVDRAEPPVDAPEHL